MAIPTICAISRPFDFEQANVPAELWDNQIVTQPGVEGGDGASMMVPFNVRNEPVGYLSFEEPAASMDWSEDNVAVIEAVREQLSLALENRLLIDQSQNALREARQREQEVRFLQEVAAFLNATENIVTSQDELCERLRTFIPVSGLSITGYDEGTSVTFDGNAVRRPVEQQ